MLRRWMVMVGAACIGTGCTREGQNPATFPAEDSTMVSRSKPEESSARASRAEAERPPEDRGPPPPAQVDPTTLPDEQRRALSLPEIRVENIGLHIGGGPNTPEGKEPFLRAIAEHFRDFRLCYVESTQPTRGGVFGVDLRIDREGGHPEVSPPRTKMQGDAFRRCMLDSFRRVTFGRLDEPTVISYSLRFVYQDTTAPR